MKLTPIKTAIFIGVSSVSVLVAKRIFSLSPDETMYLIITQIICIYILLVATYSPKEKGK